MDTKQSTANAQAALSKSENLEFIFFMLDFGGKYIVNEQNVCIYKVIQ